MKVEVHNVYDPDKLREVNPLKVIGSNLSSTDSMLKSLEIIKPEAVEGYVSSLNGRLLDAVKGYDKPQSFNVKEIVKELTHIKDRIQLQESITQFTCMHLGVTPMNLTEKVIEVTGMMYTKSVRRLGYHRVKALVELLGLEEGESVFKEIVARRHRAKRATLEDKTPTVERVPQSVKNWTNTGFADFTVAVLDNHRVLYRFDNCLVPASLEDFNDPDIAYLSSCYQGDSPEWNPGRSRYMMRTQTLHHADFCDEFYWDVNVYPNPEQPALEFTKNLGKENNLGEG